MCTDKKVTNKIKSMEGRAEELAFITNKLSIPER